ncbi:acetylesterase [Opitutaceae bacterium TAV5]|nr:acetylesterase [Opitutaceae bacterium TAV5]
MCYLNSARFLAIACALFALSAIGRAEIWLPTIFSDHAVLQKSARTPVWGKAEAGQKITVTLNRATADATADASGKWRVDLDLSDNAIGAGPHRLVVQAGASRREIADVLLGEVWLCSGQSNMEFTLGGALGAKEEIAGSDDPALRQFRVPKKDAVRPAEDCEGRWVVAHPETAAQFSAVAWHFGKNLRRELSVPVGLINASWGSTPCELWMSPEGLAADPELRATRDKLLAWRTDILPAYKKEWRAWAQKYERNDANAKNATPPPANDANNAAAWRTVTLPGQLTPDGFSGEGIVWLRKKITVSPLPPTSDGRARPFRISLGGMRGSETVFWNGKRIGGTDPAVPVKPVRHYTVPGHLVRAGAEAVLDIRLFVPLGDAALGENGGVLRAGKTPLSGDWLTRGETSFPPLSDEARNACPAPPENPDEAGTGGLVSPYSLFFNGLIHPLIPNALRGVIWYQGETNTGRAFQYRSTFPALIRDWRKQWGRGDFPFYFCQLASFGMKHDEPGRASEWAELREAQTFALKLSETGMAVLTDLGEAGDIHPRNKAEVGRRLSLIALANTYGKMLPFSGPVVASVAVEKDTMRIRFKNTYDGLIVAPLPDRYRPKSLEPATLPLRRHAPAGELEGFMICGADRRWHWAEARIEGDDSVVVSSASVPEPVAVRYAWADNPTCNLYNAAGLPAAPFRTDDFPLSTINRRF